MKAIAMLYLILQQARETCKSWIKFIAKFCMRGESDFLFKICPSINKTGLEQFKVRAQGCLSY